MQSATPFDIATCMYYTGMDPFTKKPVKVAKAMRDRKAQRAMMQFFKPENWFAVREALIRAGRADLIGSGCDSLIPANPPKEALEKRRRDAQRAVEGDHYHTVPNPKKGGATSAAGGGGTKPTGYRPGRKSAGRRSRRS
jgi:hypothetical protein